MGMLSGKEDLYAIAEQFASLCIENDRSLLWPDKQVWTIQNLTRLKSAFIDSPDTSSETFLVKLERQLANESEDIHRMAELREVQKLIPLQ